MSIVSIIIIIIVIIVSMLIVSIIGTIIIIQRLVEYGWKPQCGFSCHKNNSPCCFLTFWGAGFDTCLCTFRLPFLIPHILNYAHVQVPLFGWLLALASTTNKQVCWAPPQVFAHISIISLCLMEPSPGPGQCLFWGPAGVIFGFQRCHFRNSTRNRF